MNIDQLNTKLLEVQISFKLSTYVLRPMYLTDHSNARPAQKKTKWHPFVWYSNGLTIQYSNTGPIAIQPLFDHLNTELIRHSDLYCIENIYNSIPDLTWNKDIVWKLVSWLQDMLMGIQPNQVLAPHWNDVLKLWLETLSTGLLGNIHKWRHKQRGHGQKRLNLCVLRMIPYKESRSNTRMVRTKNVNGTWGYSFYDRYYFAELVGEYDRMTSPETCRLSPPARRSNIMPKLAALTCWSN